MCYFSNKANRKIDDRDTSSEKQKLVMAHNGQQYWGNTLVTNWLADTIFTLSRSR